MRGYVSGTRASNTTECSSFRNIYYGVRKDLTFPIKRSSDMFQYTVLHHHTNFSSKGILNGALNIRLFWND